MRMMGKRLLVEQATTEAVTEGGIALPEQSVHRLPRGLVVQIGPDVTTITVDDRVIINTLAGLPVEIDGNEYLVLDEVDVLLILEGEEK